MSSDVRTRLITVKNIEYKLKFVLTIFDSESLMVRKLFNLLNRTTSRS